MLFRFYNFFLFAEGKCFVLDPVDQRKQHICAQANRKDINGGVDIPAKPLGELLKHNNRGITSVTFTTKC